MANYDVQVSIGAGHRWLQGDRSITRKADALKLASDFLRNYRRGHSDFARQFFQTKARTGFRAVKIPPLNSAAVASWELHFGDRKGYVSVVRFEV